jgi:SAM-dependent methyltransferase
VITQKKQIPVCNKSQNNYHIEQLIANLTASLSDNSLVQISLTAKRSKDSELKSVFAKPVLIKKGLHLSFIYRYPTKDITKNHTIEESTNIILALLESDFLQATLRTTEADFLFSIDKNSGQTSLKKLPPSATQAPNLSHDKQKARIITLHNNLYLKELGVLTNDFKVKANMQDKYRQINKYVEIVDGVLKDVDLGCNFTVADMGSGKGYLTFALYDYLVNICKLSPQVVGVELRSELVKTCNAIAQKSGFSNLHFETGTIQNAQLPAIDVLIALHACNTATDDAIARGIAEKSRVIICAPCCHKQIRKELNPSNALAGITKNGILAERQAELLTDAIRALLMEAHGYKTRVFEFIDTEHTPKNLLIVGVKSSHRYDKKKLAQVNEIKELFGIKEH